MRKTFGVCTSCNSKNGEGREVKGHSVWKVPPQLCVMQYMNGERHLRGHAAQEQERIWQCREITVEFYQTRFPHSMSDLSSFCILFTRSKGNICSGKSFMLDMVACTTSLLDDVKKSRLFRFLCCSRNWVPLESSYVTERFTRSDVYELWYTRQEFGSCCKKRMQIWMRRWDECRKDWNFGKVQT